MPIEHGVRLEGDERVAVWRAVLPDGPGLWRRIEKQARLDLAGERADVAARIRNQRKKNARG